MSLSQRACPEDFLFRDSVWEPALKWFCSGSSRDAPARDLALKSRCTLKNGELADRCSKRRCPLRSNVLREHFKRLIEFIGFCSGDLELMTRETIKYIILNYKAIYGTI